MRFDLDETFLFGAFEVLAEMLKFEVIIPHEETEPFDDGIRLPEQFLVRPLVCEENVYSPHAAVKRLYQVMFHFCEFVKTVDIDHTVLVRAYGRTGVA